MPDTLTENEQRLIRQLRDVVEEFKRYSVFLEANAALIAAAPELVEALQMFVKEYEGTGRDEREERPEMIAARAALAKAGVV